MKLLLTFIFKNCPILYKGDRCELSMNSSSNTIVSQLVFFIVRDSWFLTKIKLFLHGNEFVVFDKGGEKKVFIFNVI